MTDWTFNLLYDGDCPFCMMEVRWLGRWNRRGRSAVTADPAEAPTGWPVLRCFFDALYEWFARNRVRLGRFFGRKCASGTCTVAHRPGKAAP